MTSTEYERPLIIASLNPVRAAMVASPEEYRWSSVHTSLGITIDPIITPHASYLASGSDPAQRETSYREWLRQGMSDEDLHAIRSHLQQERALGSSTVPGHGGKDLEPSGFAAVARTPKEDGDRSGFGLMRRCDSNEYLLWPLYFHFISPLFFLSPLTVPKDYSVTPTEKPITRPAHIRYRT